MQNDSFLQQALFFGSHHEVMCVILVVDNVFQVNTYKIQEKDVLSPTKQFFIFFFAIVGCHVIIRGAITRLRARKQNHGDIVTSAVNCGALASDLM